MLGATFSIGQRSGGKSSAAFDKLALAAASLGKYAAEAGIPAPLSVSSESTPPAQYMRYQDLGYWAGATYVPPKPWLTGTIRKQESAWYAIARKHAGAVLLGKTQAPAVMLTIATTMRNDFLDAITHYGLIDTGNARQSVSFRVVGYSRGWSR